MARRQLPKRPRAPNAGLLVGGGLFGGILFAFFACAAIDLRSRRVVEAWQIRRELQLPVLAKLDR